MNTLIIHPFCDAVLTNCIQLTAFMELMLKFPKYLECSSNVGILHHIL